MQISSFSIMPKGIIIKWFYFLVSIIYLRTFCIFSGVFYFLNATINPILYSVMSKRFRQAFRDKLCQPGLCRLLCFCCGDVVMLMLGNPEGTDSIRRYGGASRRERPALSRRDRPTDNHTAAVIMKNPDRKPSRVDNGALPEQMADERNGRSQLHAPGDDYHKKFFPQKVMEFFYIYYFFTI